MYNLRDSMAGSSVNLLICLGERKRPISVERGATFDQLRQSIVEAFGDVLPSASKSTPQVLANSLIVQVRMEGRLP